MITPTPAFGLGVLESLGFALEGIYSASPRRAILWQAQDASGNGVVDENGQPVMSALYPQVVVEERAYDEMEITRKPVEYGAPITDHAFKLPTRIEIRGGWSFAAASGGSFPIPSPIPVATDPSYLQNIYDTLLGIQTQRSFVTLVTGKKTYTNVLIHRLSQHTDQKTENVFNFVAECEQVLIAYTQTVSVPDASVMTNPAANAAPTKVGQSSLLPASKLNVSSANSFLAKSLQLQ